MPSSPSAKDVLGILSSTGLNAAILPEEDPRWSRLQLAAGPGMNLRDRFRGTLIGGSIGDAMGRPNEGASSSEAGAYHIREYRPWQGYRGGPKVTITDDTQMTMWLGDAILGASHEPRAEGREGKPRDQRSEDRGQGVGGCWQRAAGSRQKSEIRGQRSEIRDRQEPKQIVDWLIDPDALARRFTLVLARHRKNQGQQGLRSGIASLRRLVLPGQPRGLRADPLRGRGRRPRCRHCRRHGLLSCRRVSWLLASPTSVARWPGVS